MSAHIYAYEDIARMTLHMIQGNGVQHAAVDEYHAVALNGFVEGG